MITCSVLFAMNNHVDETTYISTNYGSSVPDFTTENWKNREMWKFGRMNPPAGSVASIVVEFTDLKPIHLVSMVKHRFTTTGQWRIQIWLNRASRTANDSPVYDSNWIAICQGIDQFGQMQWGQFHWGQYSFEMYQGAYNRIAVHVLPERVVASYMEISVQDQEAVNLDGFMQFARLWVSDAWQPSNSASYGSSFIYTDQTGKQISESGVTHVSKRLVKRRSMNIIMDDQDKYEFMTYFVGPIVGMNGASVEGIVILDPTDDPFTPYQTIYGFISDPTTTLNFSSYRRISTTINVQESV